MCSDIYNIRYNNYTIVKTQHGTYMMIT